MALFRTSGASNDWLGHPKALTFLFLTGMWEVAALAGMRTILVFHLTSDLHLPVATAVQVFGLSTAASFMMSFVGAAVADRLLGIGRSVLLGALIMAIGHTALIVDGLLYPALAVIALGSGFFRPTLIADVWRLYRDDDPRTSDALLRYKLGCNFGGIIGPIACGALYEFVGWSAAMLFSGAGMLLAAAIYLASARSRSAFDVERRAPVALDRPSKLQLAPGLIVGAALVLTGGSLHWVAANQQGGTLAVFTLDSVIRTIAIGSHVMTIPAGWFQTINPILILLLAPMLSWAWTRWPARDAANAEVVRMVAGSALLALSFLVLAAAVAASPNGQIHWGWLVLSTLPLTLGELYLDTMGQAYFCRHAPIGYLSTFLSLWMLTSTIGYLGAASLAAFWEKMPATTFFELSAAVAMASAFLLAVVYLVNRRYPDAHHTG